MEGISNSPSSLCDGGQNSKSTMISDSVELSGSHCEFNFSSAFNQVNIMWQNAAQTVVPKRIKLHYCQVSSEYLIIR